MVKRHSMAWTATTLLLGCQTAYAPLDCPPTGNPWPLPGWNCDGGYSHAELAPDVYQVRFEGRGISAAQSNDYALLRAAELTLEEGRRYFVIGGTQDETQVRHYSSPSAPMVVGGDETPITVWSTGGGTSSVTLPSQSFVIRMYKERPEGPVIVYEATTVQHSIRSRYGLPVSPPAVAAEH